MFDSNFDQKNTLKRFVLFLLSVVLLLIAFFSESMQAKENSLGTSREIILPDFQYEKLKADLPIDSIIMDKQNTVWMAGRTSIWRWQLSSNHLQKINLLKSSKTDRLRRLLIHDKSLIAMSNQQLFQIQFDPVRLTRLKSNDKKVVSLKMASDGKNLFWITTGGVYAADLRQKTLIHMSQTPRLFSQDKIGFVPENATLWYLRGKKLFIRNLIGESVKSKLLLHARNKLVDLHKISDNVFVHTKYSILRYSTTGHLRQRIPVEGNRKLVLMSLSDEYHAYLFSDKLLEVFDLSSKTANHFRLNIGVVKKAKNLVSRGAMLALISDGKPRAFQLSGKWN